jgi:hypothetical protein
MRTLILPLFAVAAPLAFGQHLFSFGIKGGFPLTDIVPDTTINSIDTTAHVFSSSKDYVVGPTLELNLPLGLAVEADALYRPFNFTGDLRVIPRTTTTQVSDDVSSVEFPILLKAHILRGPVVKPFVEIGPAFRYLAAPIQYLSNTGFSLGGGVDFKLPIVRLSAEVRYSRWGHDAGGVVEGITIPSSNRNQAEFLLGLSF